jgi:hypothetical protein
LLRIAFLATIIPLADWASALIGALAAATILAV